MFSYLPAMNVISTRSSGTGTGGAGVQGPLLQFYHIDVCIVQITKICILSYQECDLHLVFWHGRSRSSGGLQLRLLHIYRTLRFDYPLPHACRSCADGLYVSIDQFISWLLYFDACHKQGVYLSQKSQNSLHGSPQKVTVSTNKCNVKVPEFSI